VTLRYVAAASCLLVALFAWQGDSYVNYAEGVYLFSSGMVADGSVPYRDFIAAHPPLLFYSGAAILAVWDSLDAVRVVMALVGLGTGALVMVIVRRLTGSGWAGVLAGLLALVTPWTLHEHATLMPESFGAPLLLAAALLAARPRTAVAAGLLGAVAVGFKWPFLLPALLVGVAAPARVRYLGALAIGFAAGVLLSFALFGADRLYEQLVTAQQEIGWHSLRETGGLAVQAAWNLLPLAVPAAAGLLLRRRTEDPPLLATLLALTAGGVILIGTITKTGTYLNTVALVEPPLVVLAVAGTVWLLRSALPRRSVLLGAIAAALALGAAQVIAFVLRPTDPGIFVRPFSAPAHGWHGKAIVAQAKRETARCPAGVPYSGPPFLAFVSDRPMPGDEPDQFLLATAVGARAARAVAADMPRCPGG
jgi:hypothetical protein